MLTIMIRYKAIDDLTFYSMLSILQGGMWLLNDLENYLDPYNLSHGRFSIMLAVLHSDGTPLSPSKLASDLGKSKPTITKMIDKLRDEELIVKTQSPTDKRERFLKLTHKGEELLNRIIPGYNERIIGMSASLSKLDKTALLDIISKIDFPGSRKIRTVNP